jgi:hypothetical protein
VRQGPFDCAAHSCAAAGHPLGSLGHPTMLQEHSCPAGIHTVPTAGNCEDMAVPAYVC